MQNKRFDIKVKVVSVKKPCNAGHKVGDEWIFKDGLTPAGICIGADV